MKISEGGNRILISGLCSQLDLSIHAQIAPQPMHCMSRLANKNIVKPISTSKIVNEINFPAPTVCIEYNKENPNLGDGLIVLADNKKEAHFQRHVFHLLLAQLTPVDLAMTTKLAA